MAAVTTCSDFGASPNQVCRCFHYFCRVGWQKSHLLSYENILMSKLNIMLSLRDQKKELFKEMGT